ncbi:MAG: tetratricopeptide repeat protein [Thermodesulfobacteriota bacterium]
MSIKNYIVGAAVAAALALPLLAGCSKSDDTRKTATGGVNAPAAGPQVNSTALIDDLKARLKEDPNDADILWRLADVYFESKQFAESSEYYKKVIAVKPNETDVYNDLGLSQHYMGNSSEALRYINEGIKKNPYHQRIWLTKGFIMAYGMGDLEGAKTAWEKANALNPESQIGKAAADFLAQFKDNGGKDKQ